MVDPAAAAMWTGLNSGVLLSLFAVLWTVAWRNLQNLNLQRFSFAWHLSRHARRLAAMMDPYMSVIIEEYDDARMGRSKAYEEARAYLAAVVSFSYRHDGVRRFRGEQGARDTDALLLSMADREKLADEFQGVTVWWVAESRREEGLSRGRGGEHRFFTLYFHERHSKLIRDVYIPHVRHEGRAAIVRNRQRKLHRRIGAGSSSHWKQVVFDHPMTFAKLAMDPAKKKEVVDDLDAFRKRKDWFASVGKAWKRGYLLHGPPGTGKSAMIAAMANYLDYDIYDIELTSVLSNDELRQIFLETKSKSIIVIEDIDCSLGITGARTKQAAADDDAAGDSKAAADDKSTMSAISGRVTLSGLLNSIDGLWSACVGERIIVFTTNHVEKLDTALIRRGRMDMHIEMSYCCFEAFRFLAKTYLDVDEADEHELFGDVGELLREVDMTPADVAENLTPKSTGDDAKSCLRALVKALQEAKEKKATGGGKDQDKEELLDMNLVHI